jgi:TIR domain
VISWRKNGIVCEPLGSKAIASRAVGSAMSDIFISYSKADHALALKLSAFLEAEGWSVWWDTSLGAADLYRDEIMKQLALARAVVAIWTENSVKSDWVRAEAGTAKKEGKLIPVKTTDVAYGDIPLPFGEMHTENIASTDLIRAAVVAQLAKPAVEPSATALLAKGFKYELLTWVGIVGGALTLFTNLGSVLKLADWARVFVQHWKEWTHAFWAWAFGWLGIHLAPDWVPVLSFLSFGSLLTIGQAVKFKKAMKPAGIVTKPQETSFRLKSWRTFVCLVLSLIIGFFSFVGVASLLRLLPATNAVYTIVLLAVGSPTVVIIMLLAKDRFYAAVSAFFVNIFFVIIAFNQLLDVPVSVYSSAIALIMSWSFPVFLLTAAPAKAISRRLIFLALGLLLLIALNELSKLGLDVTAPKQG